MLELSFDHTLDAMKRKAEELRAQEPSRPYLGASEIGGDCDRALYYSYNNAPSNIMGWQGCFATEDGHRTEDLTAERLALVDGIVIEVKDKDGKQFGFSDFDGRFKGHIDGFITGLIQAPKTTHIWENKACGQKKFDEFKRVKAKHGEKNTLKAWNYTYYVQAVLYMDYFDLTRHYTTVALAGGRDYNSCRTEANPELAKAMRGRAKRIIEARNPPPKLDENPEYFGCRFCRYKEHCHG
jgi:hypothetical protein